jgi:hypothetical protein
MKLKATSLFLEICLSILAFAASPAYAATQWQTGGGKLTMSCIATSAVLGITSGQPVTRAQSRGGGLVANHQVHHQEHDDSAQLKDCPVQTPSGP